MIAITIICFSLAVGFVIGWLFSKQRSALFAAVLWLATPLYNSWILASCPGDCNIRVDLLLVLPLLFSISIAALIFIVREGWQRKKALRRNTRPPREAGKRQNQSQT